jgi:hypothetical protein
VADNPYGFDAPDDEESCEDCGWVGSDEAFHTCGDEDET